MKIRLYLATITSFAILLFFGTLQAQDISTGEFQQLTEGHQFTEGPYWHPDGYLLYSDIPANAIYKWSPKGEKEVFLEPSGHSNGIIGDDRGGIIIAQHDGTISHVNAEKEVSVLVDSYRGNRLNSPNDLARTTDGTIYFTDPPFGVDEQDRELEFSGVYRLSKDQKEPELLYDQFETPNGIVFTPDEDRFFVNDTRTGKIMAFDLDDQGTVSDPHPFADVGTAQSSGAADGMAVDRKGNLYTTGPAGIHVFNPGGEQIATISTPERVTNMAWGSENRNTLFMTTPSGVYNIEIQ